MKIFKTIIGCAALLAASWAVFPETASRVVNAFGGGAQRVDSVPAEACDSVPAEDGLRTALERKAKGAAKSVARRAVRTAAGAAEEALR